jgi:hypothetical protein
MTDRFCGPEIDHQLEPLPAEPFAGERDMSLPAIFIFSTLPAMLRTQRA